MLIAEFSHKGEEIEIENELWQYDYGQRIQIKGLDLPETFEVHFAWKDSEKAKVVIGSTVNGISTVDIPNVALEQRRTITAYIYLSGITEGETVNTIILSVNKRKAPENFGTPEDVDLFHHTLAATAEYQRQAKESEKQAAARSADAEAWAHGREDHPDQEQDNAKYYAEQAAASQQAAELLQQRVSDLATQAQNNIGEAQQQAIKTITEQQGISIQKIKNQTAESEDNLKNTIRVAEQIKTDLDTEVENATPIKQGLDDSNTAAIKTKVDLDKSNTIADQIKAELEVLNTTASKTKTNLDGANKIATDLTGTLENEISEGIQTKIDIQTTAEKAMSKSVYQTLDHSDGAWAVGDGKGKYGITNRNSINIEICVNPETDYYKAVDKAEQLAAQLLKQYGWGTDRLKRHYDASRKNCPRRIQAEGRWPEFVQKTAAYMKGASTVNTKTNTTSNTAKKTVSLTGKMEVQLPVIQKGSKGTAVSMLQAMLGVKVDGDFGNDTDTSLKAFQKNVKLTADGICGKDTWTKVIEHVKANTK